MKIVVSELSTGKKIIEKWYFQTNKIYFKIRRYSIENKFLFMEFHEIFDHDTGMLLMNLDNRTPFWFDMDQIENELFERLPNIVAHRLWPAQLLVNNENVVIKFKVLINVMQNLGILQFIKKK